MLRISTQIKRDLFLLCHQSPRPCRKESKSGWSSNKRLLATEDQWVGYFKEFDNEKLILKSLCPLPQITQLRFEPLGPQRTVVALIIPQEKLITPEGKWFWKKGHGWMRDPQASDRGPSFAGQNQWKPFASIVHQLIDDSPNTNSLNQSSFSASVNIPNNQINGYNTMAPFDSTTALGPQGGTNSQLIEWKFTFDYDVQTEIQSVKLMELKSRAINVQIENNHMNNSHVDPYYNNPQNIGSHNQYANLLNSHAGSEPSMVQPYSPIAPKATNRSENLPNSTILADKIANYENYLKVKDFPGTRQQERPTVVIGNQAATNIKNISIGEVNSTTVKAETGLNSFIQTNNSAKFKPKQAVQRTNNSKQMTENSELDKLNLFKPLFKSYLSAYCSLLHSYRFETDELQRNHAVRQHTNKSSATKSAVSSAMDRAELDLLYCIGVMRKRVVEYVMDLVETQWFESRWNSSQQKEPNQYYEVNSDDQYEYEQHSYHSSRSHQSAIPKWQSHGPLLIRFGPSKLLNQTFLANNCLADIALITQNQMGGVSVALEDFKTDSFSNQRLNRSKEKNNLNKSHKKTNIDGLLKPATHLCVAPMFLVDYMGYKILAIVNCGFTSEKLAHVAKLMKIKNKRELIINGQALPGYTQTLDQRLQFYERVLNIRSQGYKGEKSKVQRVIDDKDSNDKHIKKQQETQPLLLHRSDNRRIPLSPHLSLYRVSCEFEVKELPQIISQTRGITKAAHELTTIDVIADCILLFGVDRLFPIDPINQLVKEDLNRCIRPELVAAWRDKVERGGGLIGEASSTERKGAQNTDQVMEGNTQLVTESLFMVSHTSPSMLNSDNLIVGPLKLLHQLHIPQLLDRLQAGQLILIDSFSIKQALSEEGINMRYLYKIYESTTLVYIKQLFLAEVLGRAAKRIWREWVIGKRRDAYDWKDRPTNSSPNDRKHLSNGKLASMNPAKRLTYGTNQKGQQTPSKNKESDVSRLLRRNRQLNFLKSNDTEKLKNQQCPSLPLLLDFLNLIFGKGPQSNGFWQVLNTLTVEKYKIPLPKERPIRPGVFLTAVLWHLSVRIDGQIDKLQLWKAQHPFGNDFVWKDRTVTGSVSTSSKAIVLKGLNVPKLSLSFIPKVKCFEFPSLRVQRTARQAAATMDSEIGFNYTYTKAYTELIKLNIIINELIDQHGFNCQVGLSRLNSISENYEKPSIGHMPHNLHPCIFTHYLTNRTSTNFEQALKILDFSLPSEHPLYISLYLAYATSQKSAANTAPQTQPTQQDIANSKLLNLTAAMRSICIFGRCHPQTERLYSRLFNMGFTELQGLALGSADVEDGHRVCDKLFKLGRYETCLIKCETVQGLRESTKSNMALSNYSQNFNPPESMDPFEPGSKGIFSMIPAVHQMNLGSQSSDSPITTCHLLHLGVKSALHLSLLSRALPLLFAVSVISQTYQLKDFDLQQRQFELSLRCLLMGMKDIKQITYLRKMVMWCVELEDKYGVIPGQTKTQKNYEQLPSRADLFRALMNESQAYGSYYEWICHILKGLISCMPYFDNVQGMFWKGESDDRTQKEPGLKIKPSIDPLTLTFPSPTQVKPPPRHQPPEPLPLPSYPNIIAKFDGPPWREYMAAVEIIVRILGAQVWEDILGGIKMVS